MVILPSRSSPLGYVILNSAIYDSAAVSESWIATPRKTTSYEYFRHVFSSMGASSLQGGHHDAQKLPTIGFSIGSSVLNVSPLKSTRLIGGAGLLTLVKPLLLVAASRLATAHPRSQKNPMMIINPNMLAIALILMFITFQSRNSSLGLVNSSFKLVVFIKLTNI